MYYQTSISTESNVLGRVRKLSSHVHFCETSFVISLRKGLKGVGEYLFCEKDSLTKSTVVSLVCGDGLLEFMLKLLVVFSSKTTRNADVHWMKYSPRTSNVRPGYAGDLMAGGVHCCSSGWASKSHCISFSGRV